MQPTVTARPATWAGTSAPILYKFTSTNYSNAGYYMAVEVWNSTTAAKIADAKYYANTSGAVTVDVSAFLKSAMSLDNTADLTTSDVVYTDGNWVKYYIKYREYWTAGSESQVDDVANFRYAIYGGLQLGNVNDFSGYTVVPFKMLSSTGDLTSIVGRPFVFSFILPEYKNEAFLKVVRYLSGNVLDTNYYAIENISAFLGKIKEVGTADRIDISIASGVLSIRKSGEPAEWAANMGYANHDTGGAAWNLVADNAPITMTISGVGTYESDILYKELSPIQEGEDLTFLTDCSAGMFSGTFGVQTSIMTIGFYDVAFSAIGSLETILTSTTNGLAFGGVTDNLTVPAGAVYFGVQVFVNASGGSPSGTRLFNLTILEQTEKINISETKTINIIEECQNTVMLQWRNSLGGVECYPFTYNQEYTWDYTGGKKAKRLTLFANNLTLNQWEAIQGLNTLGELYRTPITEMTTSLNRTSSTIGQSVYVLNSDGTKVGVNVIGQSNTTNTKQKRHSAIVTIEYPELFLQ